MNGLVTAAMAAMTLWLAAPQGGQAYLDALREAGRSGAESEAISLTTATRPDAVWVGDHLRYSLEFRTIEGVAIHTDDLDPAFLEGTPWEVVSHSVSTVPTADGGTLYEVEYVLTTFEVGVEAVEIPSLEVRYYASDSPAGDALQTERIRTQPVQVPVRSTLPDAAVVQSIRALPPAGVSPQSLWRRWRGLLPLLAGLGLVAFAGALALARRPAGSQEKASLPVADWEGLARHPAADVEDRREAYARLDQILRGALSERLPGVVAACTTNELQRRLGSDDDSWLQLLRRCEQGKYAPPPRVPSEEQWRTDLQQGRTIVREQLR